MGAEPEVPPEEATSELGVGGWAVCQAGPWGQGVVAGEGSSMLRGPEALREWGVCWARPGAEPGSTHGENLT